VPGVAIWATFCAPGSCWLDPAAAVLSTAKRMLDTTRRALSLLTSIMRAAHTCAVGSYPGTPRVVLEVYSSTSTRYFRAVDGHWQRVLGMLTCGQ